MGKFQIYKKGRVPWDGRGFMDLSAEKIKRGGKKKDGLKQHGQEIKTNSNPKFVLHGTLEKNAFPPDMTNY